MQSISSCLPSSGTFLSSTSATLVQYAQTAGQYVVLAGQYSMNGIIVASQCTLSVLQTAGLAIANLASRVWQEALPIIQQLVTLLAGSASTISQFVVQHRTHFAIAAVAIVVASTIAYLCANCYSSEENAEESEFSRGQQTFQQEDRHVQQTSQVKPRRVVQTYRNESQGL